jgi:protein-tyrosine-phosphatase
MKKIMFICTGNTCRSPMAMGLFREMLRQRGIEDVVCESAGLYAMAGDAAEPNAVEAASELGADISAHHARPFSPYMAQDTDLFVCMTPVHALQLYDIPEEKKYILAGGVPDPYGGNLEEYRKCAKLISEGLQKLLKLVETMTTPPAGP